MRRSHSCGGDRLEEQMFGITNRGERMMGNHLGEGANPCVGRPGSDSLTELSHALRVTPATLLGSTEAMVVALHAFHGLNGVEQHHVVEAIRKWNDLRALGGSLCGASVGGR